MDACVMLELRPRWSGMRVGWFSQPSDGERGREGSAVVETASRLRGSASCVSAGIAGERRRSRAAVLRDRDAKLLRLIGKVRRDARAREYGDADREDVENPVTICVSKVAGNQTSRRLGHLSGAALCCLRSERIRLRRCEVRALARSLF